MIFATVPPAAGPYQSFTVVVPANTGRITQTVTAAIGPSTLLATFSPPAGGYGGGGITITAALPGGVTEAYLQVTDYGTPPNLEWPLSQALATGPETATPQLETRHRSRTRST